MEEFRNPNPKANRGVFRVQITTTISPEFRKFLQDNKIPASAALARGVKTLRDEIAGEIPKTDLLLKNIEKLQAELTRLYSRIAELEANAKLVTS